MTLNVNMHKEFHKRPGVVIPALGKLTQENKLEVSMAIQKKKPMSKYNLAKSISEI